ncbi:MAG: glycine cleavage system transcriptional repressor [Planctomycetota bacterium]|jgi:glycine cleavage system transcriptional repressor
MKSYFVVGVIGPDRAGIVDEVSRIVAAAECNIEDSRMAVLGADFGLMMLFSGEGERAARAAEEVAAWGQREDMSVVSRPTAEPPGEPVEESGAVAEIGLEMPDSPGIVSRVTHFLAERGANVETLETEVLAAPFTGTPTFAMHVNVRSGQRIPMEELRAALQDLADDEDIHITVGTSV